MPYLEHVSIVCGTNNINKDSPFDISECLIEIGKYFTAYIFPAYFLEMNIENIGSTRENGALNPNLYFKDNAHFIEQGNTKLASSILATVNGNISLQHVVNP